MSVLSDILGGNVGNIGNDLNPSNILSDAGTDLGNIVSNPLADIGIAASIALPFIAPEILPGLGALTGLGSDVGAAATEAAADVGTDAALTPLALTTDATGAALSSSGLTAIDTALNTGASAATGGAATGIDALSTIGPGVSSAGTSLSSLLPTTAASTASGGGGILDSLTTGAINSITKNPLGIALSGGGLLYTLLKGNQTDPNQAALQAEAPQLLAQGQQLSASAQQLQSYLTSGTLPPALQAQVTSAVNAAKAQIIANHAANGQSTNPTQNSALAQELAQADINGLSLAGNLEQQLFNSGTQLLQTGINETGLSTQIYQTLVGMDQANNQQLMSAIASMAAALGGGSNVKLSLGTA